MEKERKALSGRYLSGSQEWWKERTDCRNKLNYRDFRRDVNYRIWRMGCGVVAMVDLQRYLERRIKTDGELPDRDNPDAAAQGEAGAPAPGVKEPASYMAGLQELMRTSYPMGGDPLHYITGLLPWTMERGLAAFLRRQSLPWRRVRWAPFPLGGKKRRAERTLREIERMLEQDLPVVFSYHSFRKERPLHLFPTLRAALERDERAPGGSSVLSHYMTIVGVLGPEPVLEVVSWGKPYFVRYEEYAARLSYFSNILDIS